MSDLSKHRALVTGASSGIGAEMARILAGWGCHLTITARRLDRLEALARDIRKDTAVDVRCVALDLGLPGSAAALYRDIIDHGEDIDILINNAGFGVYQAFAVLDWSVQAQMLQLNVLSLVELTHKLLPHMLGRDRRCYILNVSSIGAYQPVPYFACYAASKSFVRDFSEALAHELRRTNVSVTSLCPGGTRTEFSEVAGQKLGKIANASMMDAHAVAMIGLKAMLHRRRNIVAGFMNSLLCFMMRLIPRRVAAWGSVMVLEEPEPPRPASQPVLVSDAQRTPASASAASNPSPRPSQEAP